jgi:NADH-quinone oxidoreductase subunit J
MSLILVITAVVTLLAAVAAMSLRNLVHSALTLAVSFSGVAAIYLQLNAEFAGFTEILVYVGAIAILIVMAILLTRSGETPEKSVLTSGWLAGIAVTALVFTILGWAVLSSSALPAAPAVPPHVTVKDIGMQLMTQYVLPLEIIGLVLTVAMIGAVVIACKEEAPARILPVVAKTTEPQPAPGNPAAPIPAAAGAFKKAGAA